MMTSKNIFIAVILIIFTPLLISAFSKDKNVISFIKKYITVEKRSKVEPIFVEKSNKLTKSGETVIENPTPDPNRPFPTFSIKQKVAVKGNYNIKIHKITAEAEATTSADTESDMDISDDTNKLNNYLKFEIFFEGNMVYRKVLPIVLDIDKDNIYYSLAIPFYTTFQLKIYDESGMLLSQEIKL